MSCVAANCSAADQASTESIVDGICLAGDPPVTLPSFSVSEAACSSGSTSTTIPSQASTVTVAANPTTSSSPSTGKVTASAAATTGAVIASSAAAENTQSVTTTASTNQPTTTPGNSGGGGSGLSGGAIGGIVGGVLGGLLLLAIGASCYIFGRWRRSEAILRGQQIEQGSPEDETKTEPLSKDVGAANVETAQIVETDYGGRLRYPTQDVEIGGRLNEPI